MPSARRRGPARPRRIPYPRGAMRAPLWQPSPERAERAQITAFARSMESLHGVRLPDAAALHRWSVDEPERFWGGVFRSCGVVATGDGSVLEGRDRMPGARWFPGTRLNFAENLLRRRDAAPALVFRSEGGERRAISHRELRDTVARLSRALRAYGVHPGDRVAGYLPNLPEAVVAMLAAASVGAVWSSCSPDFGVPGVLERFGQIEPRVLFAADGYRYGGRSFDTLERLAELRAKLPSVERVVVVPHLPPAPELAAIPGAATLAEATASQPPGRLPLDRLPFH